MIKSINNCPISQFFDIEAFVAYPIPCNQFEHAWNMCRWKSLFDYVQRNDSGYFLGSIIRINQTNEAAAGNRLVAVDVQQRLTTLLLLFAALYQSLKLHEKELVDDQRIELVNLKRSLVPKQGDDQLRVIPQIQNNNQIDYRAALSEVGVIGQCDASADAGKHSRNVEEAWVPLEKPFEDLIRMQGAPSYLQTLYVLVLREALALDVTKRGETAKSLVCFVDRRKLTDALPARDLGVGNA